MLSKGRDDLEDHLYKVTTYVEGAGRLHQGWRAPGCEAQSSQVPAPGTQLAGSRGLSGLEPEGQDRAGGRDKPHVQAGMGSGPASKPRAQGRWWQALFLKTPESVIFSTDVGGYHKGCLVFLTPDERFSLFL